MVPWLSRISSPLTCSIRRAIPYPCCAPITANVCRTMTSSVPCSKSSFEFSPVGIPQQNDTSPVVLQQDTLLDGRGAICYALSSTPQEGGWYVRKNGTSPGHA